MKLTPKEQEICNEYSKRDEDGFVHCHECPLNLCNGFTYWLECYATIDGRTAEAKALKRYE